MFIMTVLLYFLYKYISSKLNSLTEAPKNTIFYNFYIKIHA